jgi:predicted 3-demethylubiquinone-9 3-methyltransferase (glyoxalase superfamily)
MQKITPCLWFDNQAEEAINLYTSLFQNSRIGGLSRYGEDGPGEPGSVLTATFFLEGQEFMALNGGPQFTFTPAISFFVNCETESEVDALFQGLSEGGAVLMPMQAYPFSDKFAWLQDRFGVSWQLNLGPRPQKITPFLMFVGEQHGRAEEAMRLYTSLFPDSGIDHIVRHGPGEMEEEGTVQQAAFTLAGQQFMALESALEHNFTFNEAISLSVRCEDQAEVDRLWEALGQEGEIQQCGWLKDRFGVSWQIVPEVLEELMSDPDPARSQRVMQAVLSMVKLDVAGLQRAYEGG